MIVFASIFTLCLIAFNGMILAVVLQILIAWLLSILSKSAGGLLFICVISHAVYTDAIALIGAISLIFIWSIVIKIGE